METPRTVVAQIVPFLFNDGSELFGGCKTFLHTGVFKHPPHTCPFGQKTIMKFDVRMSKTAKLAGPSTFFVEFLSK